MHTPTPWRRILAVGSLTVLGGLLPGAASWAAPEPATAPPPAPAGTVPAGGDPFEDPAEPLVPLRARTADEEDHIHALALFAAARVAEQKQNYADALRNYQRAWRFDPDAVAALREIVPLAFNLDREEEGVRYALLLAERDPTDANLLRRLAMYLTENGQSERALKLYEKALTLPEKDGKQSANIILMRMEMGRLYFLAKKYDEASKNFEIVAEALAKPKEFGLSDEVKTALINKGELTYQLFGESHLEAGRLDLALAAFEKSAEYKPDRALELYNRARVDAKRNRPAQALARLEAYLDGHFASQGTGVYELYAEVLQALGQQDQLLPRLEKRREADPKNVPLAFYLAERYRKANALDKARPVYEQILEQRKDRPPLDAITGLVDVYRRQQETGKLLKLLGSSVGRAGSLSPLGETGDALLDDKPAAEALVAEAKRHLAAKDAPADGKSDPADRPLEYGDYLSAALIALELKDFDSAETLFKSALEAEGVKPGAVLVSWGLEMLAAHQYERAVQVFEQAVRDKVLPDDQATLLFYLAGALEMSGRTDEALERAKEAAATAKDEPRFAGRAAWIQFHAGRLDEARQSYLALLDKYDKNHESSEVRQTMRDARLVLSNIAVMQGDLDQAEEWLEQVLDEFPEDVGAMNDLGYLWADASKHLNRALAMIERAIADDPKNMAYRDSLGWVLFRLGRLEEAIAELQVAASAPDADGVIFDHLAEAQLHNEQIAAAIENWNKAIAAFERDKEPEKVEEIRAKIKQAEAEATKKAAVPQPEAASQSAPAAAAPSQPEPDK
jgi:tetratricopeptide (TPR) repeat protein